jgi:hypothetical protein
MRITACEGQVKTSASYSTGELFFSPFSFLLGGIVLKTVLIFTISSETEAASPRSDV